MKTVLLTFVLTGAVAWGMVALAGHKRPESAGPSVARTGRAARSCRLPVARRPVDPVTGARLGPATFLWRRTEARLECCRDVALDRGGAAVLRWCGQVGLERTSGRWRPAGPVRPGGGGPGLPLN